MKDPEKETRFENCVSDVNIPAGEVFTSPVLEGTEGLLHVKEVFVDGLQVKELRIRVERGTARSYSCANFTSAEENRRFVREVVMGDHEELPMGEFAIGKADAHSDRGEDRTAFCLRRYLLQPRRGYHDL